MTNATKNFLIVKQISNRSNESRFKKSTSKNSCEAAGDLISNKIADKITKVPKTSTQSSSYRVKSEEENIKLVKKEICIKDIHALKNQQIIDLLRLI